GVPAIEPAVLRMAALGRSSQRAHVASWVVEIATNELASSHGGNWGMLSLVWARFRKRAFVAPAPCVRAVRAAVRGRRVGLASIHFLRWLVVLRPLRKRSLARSHGAGYVVATVVHSIVRLSHHPASSVFFTRFWQGGEEAFL